ncbi:uncharacterized protein GGS25DRAFT_501302 [Hypoxylon fragiforme]|uniref:uncharacterized protein n=1 Tax=Hypoxylon fragiforme TaxID=63214 RepID=UPI0020C7062D|nr:uncharacterized protein GGS25DRAFT_501302 [Hypoxylon fragiforme]KAI2606445.1 hypothetical protein GGS25DRAFT_501302 [Hypoxylon fragiforme]
MPNFTITEPHPTVHQNAYVHSGRGGAGNYFRAPATTPPSGIPTQPLTSTTTLKPSPSTTTTSASSSRYHSGRGGAGNAHVSSAKPVLSFDEEFAHQTNIEQKPVGYVGRGGAGNVYGAGSGDNNSNNNGTRKSSDASSQHSASSAGSLTNIWSRLSHHRR